MTSQWCNWPNMSGVKYNKYFAVSSNKRKTFILVYKVNFATSSFQVKQIHKLYSEDYICFLSFSQISNSLLVGDNSHIKTYSIITEKNK